MENESESSEIARLEFIKAFEDFEDNMARNQRVYDDVEAALGRITRAHYPALGNWNAEQLRKLADVISRHAGSFCTQVADLDYHAHQDQ